jgi:hypothetical protein
MPVDEIKMELALQDLHRQDVPNFQATANLYSVDRTTLRRRFNGEQQSISESRSETSRRLSDAQEAVLIDFINRLTNTSLPPTSQIVKNVAEELCNMTVGKNWVGDFTRRHKDVLHSGYLRSIDNKRLNAENGVLIQKFYDQVSVYNYFYIILRAIANFQGSSMQEWRNTTSQLKIYTIGMRKAFFLGLQVS